MVKPVDDIACMLNLISYIAADKPDAIIGWRGDISVTRHAFTERVSRWHSMALRLSGEHYALYLDDSIEFAAALYGAWHAGKTIWLAADTLASTMTSLQLKVDGFFGDFPEACKPYKPFRSDHASSELAFDALNSQFLGLVVHTSGTTGQAQAISKKLSQLSTEVATLENLFGPKMGEAAIVSTVSHHHIYGLLFKVLWPLATGRAIYAHSKLFPEKLAQIIALRPCILISSPAHLKRLPAQLSWTTLHLKMIFSSGGMLTQEASQWTAKLLGQAPTEIFGSSETGGIAWRLQGLHLDDGWLPMPGVQWRISSDEELIEVRSPHLFTDDWLTLSDRIQAKDNGRFTLKGRRDRIVKIEEKRISLDLIEQQLLTSLLVAEVKLAAFHDESEFRSLSPLFFRRQYIAAVIVLSESGKALLSKKGKLALNRHLKKSLIHVTEPVALPRRWRYVEKMPLNDQGKTPQSLLRALFSDAEGQIKSSVNGVVSPTVQLLHREENSVEFELIWPSDLIYFKGHFSEAAILPGVAQVDWAIKTGRQFFDLPGRFHAMHALKFQHVILPDQVVNVKLSYDREKACLSFSYFSSAGKSNYTQHSSGRILFVEVI